VNDFLLKETLLIQTKPASFNVGLPICVKLFAKKIFNRFLLRIFDETKYFLFQMFFFSVALCSYLPQLSNNFLLFHFCLVPLASNLSTIVAQNIYGSNTQKHPSYDILDNIQF
jgi:hypothetical protein